MKMEVKMKKARKVSASTIVFAVLFAITLTTTIVLAAFSANKSASATITFANGVQLKINGASSQASGNAADVLSTAATLNWNIIKGSTTIKTGSVTNEVGDNAISLSAITFEATGPVSGTIWIAAKPDVKYNTSNVVAVTPVSGWTQIGTTGFYQKSVTLNSSGATASAESFTAAVVILASNATQDQKNGMAGRSYSANLTVKASTTQFTTDNIGS